MSIHSRILAAVLVLWAAVAQADTWQVIKNPKVNQVKFHSEATLESFDGATGAITGSVQLDGHTVNDASRAEFTVDLLKVSTGIDLRDQHMRDNHLHTKDHPTTSFKVKKVIGGGELQDGKPLKVKVVGDLDLHGVVKERTLDAVLTWHSDGKKTPAAVAGPVLRMQVKYDVALADHAIPRPAFLFMKMAEAVNMDVDIWAVPAK
jgi:polyisoprenoid-binding protein YceI